MVAAPKHLQTIKVWTGVEKNNLPQSELLMNYNSQSVDTQSTFIGVGIAITAAHWRVIQRTQLCNSHPHTRGLH